MPITSVRSPQSISTSPTRQIGSRLMETMLARSRCRPRGASYVQSFTNLLLEVTAQGSVFSLVEVTTNWSPWRTIVVRWTSQGSVEGVPMASAWMDTSSRPPSEPTRHSTGLWDPESNPPPRTAGPRFTKGRSAGPRITSGWIPSGSTRKNSTNATAVPGPTSIANSSRPSASRSVDVNTPSHVPPPQYLKGASNPSPDARRTSIRKYGETSW